LQDAGVPADDARLAARLSGGQLGRARELTGDTRALRDAFVDAATSLDGTGAHAATAAEAMLNAVHAALAAFDDDAERAGYQPRDVRRLRRRLEERQPARERLARRKALSEGLAAL